MLLYGIGYYLLIRVEEWCDRRDDRKLREDKLLQDTYDAQTGECIHTGPFDYDRHYPSHMYDRYREVVKETEQYMRLMREEHENKLITEEQYQEIKRHQSLYKAKNEDMSSLNDQMKDVP